MQGILKTTYSNSLSLKINRITEITKNFYYIYMHVNSLLIVKNSNAMFLSSNSCNVFIINTNFPNLFHEMQQEDMSHFAYACKMRYPLNLVLESWEYLWFY